MDYEQYWHNEAGVAWPKPPTAETAAAVHKETHGLVADDVVAVHEGH